MSKRRMVIVESEKVPGKFLKERLESCGPEYEVLTTASADEAIALMSRTSTDLLLAAHGGPDGIDGLALLRALRENPTPSHAILLAHENQKDDQLEALSLGCTSFLTEPYPEEKLAELVVAMLQPKQGFSGRVVGMRLEDVIQMLCHRKESTQVWVVSGMYTGTFWVHEGRIVHAECGSFAGVEAFLEIIGWEGGEFLSQVVLNVPEQTVFEDSQSLLMEGTRQKDEIRHAIAPVPGETVVQGAASAVLGAQDAQEGDAKEAPKRIMLVDDSRFVRKIVQEILESDASLKVAGYASNGSEALEKFDQLRPDLILLDWDMPVMKGSTALMHIMIKSPCPVVICSAFTGGGGPNPFDLLCLGAVDFLRKPQNNWGLDGRAADLIRRVKEAANINFEGMLRVRIPSLIPAEPVQDYRETPSTFLTVLSSATGGCSDLIRTIPSLPPELPAAVVVLHDMQEQAIGAFIDYLDRRSRIRVMPAEPERILADGTCYVHPASVPLGVLRDGERVVFSSVDDNRPGNPVDNFLIAAAVAMGKSLIAVLLSGGPESGGLDGLRAVVKSEGMTAVQDPSSSIDPRMAEQAIGERLAQRVWPADRVGRSLVELIS